MIFLFLCLQILPARESMMYETNEKGKIGYITITSQRDSLGYHVIYSSDRLIDVILDSLDLGTLAIKKFVNNRLELKISRNGKFEVWLKGKKLYYRVNGPIYDRHTLDFALRGFDYSDSFKTNIRLHIPELMIINAEVEVVGEEHINSRAGDILCWKILVIPRIIFTHRKFYFWIEKDYPHRFVKYWDSSGENYIILVDAKMDV